MIHYTMEIKTDLLLAILEKLRLAGVYALMGTEYADQLGDDFNPEKFKGYELDFANESLDLHAQLHDQMKENLDGRK